MNINMLIDKLKEKQNGSFFNITWVTDLPLTSQAKAMGITCYKDTLASVRKGIKYQNQKSVQAKVEQGKVLEHELPWGKWSDKYPGVIIEHKNNYYARFYLTPNKFKSVYYLNGVEISKVNLQKTGVVLPSYWKKDERPDAITVKVENIREVL